MQDKNQPPRTDDFRLERDGNRLILTVTPDWRSYTSTVEGDRLTEPTVTPAQTNAADYAHHVVRRTATERARLALKGASPQKLAAATRAAVP